MDIQNAHDRKIKQTRIDAHFDFRLVPWYQSLGLDIASDEEQKQLAFLRRLGI